MNKLDPDADLIGPLTELAYAYASRILIGSAKGLLTAAVVVGEDGKMEILGLPWRNDQEKLAMIVMLKLRLRQIRARGYSITTETWLATALKGDTRRPEARPDRQEAVMIIVVTPQEKHFQSWEMKRDGSGKCVALVKQERAGEMISWMANLFEP